ncbi:hypothetical protein OIU85_007696, partial [Salix viminalis]
MASLLQNSEPDNGKQPSKADQVQRPPYRRMFFSARLQIYDWTILNLSKNSTVKH